MTGQRLRQRKGSARLLLMNRAAHRADAIAGAAELEVIGAPGPIVAAHTQDTVAVRRFHVAHRAVPALAGLQAGMVVAALVGLFEYCLGNVEHARNILSNSPAL